MKIMFFGDGPWAERSLATLAADFQLSRSFRGGSGEVLIERWRTAGVRAIRV